MKKIVRIVVTVLLALLAIPGLTGLVGALLVNSLASPDLFYETAEKADWIAGVRRKAREDFVALSDVTDIPQEVTDAFLEETVTDEICMRFWTHKLTEFPTEELTNDLSDRIRRYAIEMREAGEITLTDEEWNTLEAYFPETAGYYVSAVRRDVHLNSLGTLKSIGLDYWNSFFLPFLAVCAVLTAGNVTLLILIHRDNVWKVGSIVLTGAGPILLVPAIWLKAADYAARLNLTPAYFKSFIVCFYDLSVTRLLVAGSVMTVLGLACGVTAAVCDYRKKQAKAQAEAQVEAPTEEQPAEQTEETV